VIIQVEELVNDWDVRSIVGLYTSQVLWILIKAKLSWSWKKVGPFFETRCF